LWQVKYIDKLDIILNKIFIIKCLTKRLWLYEKKLLFLSLIVLVIMAGCTNEDTPKLSSYIENSTVSKTPYISLGMQELINTLDTAKEALPVNKLIPGFENTLIKNLQSKSSIVSTRATTQSDGYNVVTGYDITGITTLFTDKKITLSNDATSFLNESLAFSGLYLLGKTVYMTGWAVKKTVNFSSDQSYVVNAYSKNHDDVMGFDPDKFPTSIDTTTYISIGYKIQKHTPRVFYFTTYIIGISVNAGSTEYTTMAPLNMSTTEWYEIFQNLTWRYYSVTK
jgi:hypothetical protein